MMKKKKTSNWYKLTYLLTLPLLYVLLTALSLPSTESAISSVEHDQQGKQITFVELTSDTIPKSPVFKVVEEMPRFPGCEELGMDPKEREACAQKKMMTFLFENLKYPAVARKNGTQGMVVIGFVVDKNGRTRNAKIVRDLKDGCGEEALRVVKLMENMNEAWIPGKQKGKAVNVEYNLPVKFKLDDKASKKEIPPPPPPPPPPPAPIMEKEMKAPAPPKPPKADKAITPPKPPAPSLPPAPPADKVEEVPFKVVEEAPRFPGCEDEKEKQLRKDCAKSNLLEYIANHIQYPEEAKKNKTEGMVIVSFIVTKDGYLRDVNIKQGIGSGCDEETIRVINSMNDMQERWTPAKQRGKAVSTMYHLPVKFALN